MRESAVDTALSLHKAGRFAQARSLYLAQLQTNPLDLKALYFLGLLEQQTSNLEAARDCLTRALKLSSQDTDIKYNLSVVLYELKDVTSARDLLVQVLADKPEHYLAHNNLGAILLEQGESDQAIRHFHRAMEIAPHYHDAFNNYAIVLTEIGEFEQARNVIESLLESDPDNIKYNLTYANVLRECDPLQAESILSNIVQSGSAPAQAYYNYAQLQYKKGRPEQAIALLEHALRIDPQYAHARRMIAFLQLSTQDFDNGWRNHMLRYNNWSTRAFDYPEPLPETLDGKVITVIKEQALGDEIFFLRFVALLKQRGATIHYVSASRVAGMICRSKDIDECFASLENAPAADEYTMRAGDIPYRLQLFLAENQPEPARLQVLPGLKNNVAGFLATLGPPPYIGLTWRAGTHEKGKLYKEMPLDRLGILIRSRDATFISVQRNPEQDELAQLTAISGRKIFDCSAYNDDLEKMLALMDFLDDYITVSNTNLHLRAALDKHAYVCVPHPAEWRWEYAGKKSLWFPMCDIYRQDINGSWDTAFVDLEKDLRSGF